MTEKLFHLDRDFTIIPNCVEVSPLSESVKVNSKSILYFGTLIRKKGLLELPLIYNEVIKTHPDVSLVLVGRDAPDIITGSTSTWEMMQRLFSAEALQKVEYVGAVAHSEIGNYIQSAAVCVFPSFAEAFPVSWLETMAYQKPIVASNIGWAPEVIADGVDGMLEDPLDHKTFAAKIIKLLSDDSLREQIGFNARAKCEKEFELSVITSKNVAFYTSALQKNSLVIREHQSAAPQL